MDNLEENVDTTVEISTLSPTEKFLNIFFNKNTFCEDTDIETLFEEDKISDFLEILSSEDFKGKVSLSAFNKFKKANSVNDAIFFNFLFNYINQRINYDTYVENYHSIISNFMRADYRNKTAKRNVKCSFLDMLKLNKNTKKIFNIRYANKDRHGTNWAPSQLLVSKYITLYLFNIWKQKGYIKSSVVSDFTNVYSSSNRVATTLNKIYKTTIDKLNENLIDNTGMNRKIWINYENKYTYLSGKRIHIKESATLNLKYTDGYNKVLNFLNDIYSNVYFYNLPIPYSNSLFLNNILMAESITIDMVNSRYRNIQSAKTEIEQPNFVAYISTSQTGDNNLEQLNSHFSYFGSQLNESYINSIANSAENVSNKLLTYCKRIGFSNENVATDVPMYYSLRNVKYHTFGIDFIGIIDKLLNTAGNSFTVSRLNVDTYLLGYLYKLKTILSISGLYNFTFNIYMPFLYFLIDFNAMLYCSSFSNNNLKYVFYQQYLPDVNSEEEIAKLIRNTLSVSNFSSIVNMSDSIRNYKIINSCYNEFLSGIDSSLVDAKDLKCRYIFYKHYSDFLNSIITSIKVVCDENDLPFDYDISSINVLTKVIADREGRVIDNEEGDED